MTNDASPTATFAAAVTPGDDTGGGRRHLLVFHVGDQDCAVGVEQVQEIVPLAALSRPAGMPSILAGFLDLDGAAIPVVRLARLLDAPDEAPGMHTPLVILRVDGRPLGLLVSGVREMVAVTADSIFHLPEQHLADCAVRIAARTVALLSPARLLLEEERQCLAELTAIQQKRLRDLEGADGEPAPD